MPRAANRALDEAVRTQHDWDTYQIDRVLDYLITMPSKGEARRRMRELFEQVRRLAVQCPELVDEIEVRRQLAQDGPAAV